MFQCKNPFILARNEHITVKEFYLCARINRIEKKYVEKSKNIGVDDCIQY